MELQLHPRLQEIEKGWAEDERERGERKSSRGGSGSCVRREFEKRKEER